MKRVKLQPRQHTILLNDEELDIIQAAIRQLVDSGQLNPSSVLYSLELRNISRDYFGGGPIDTTGQEPGVPESLLFCHDLMEDFIQLIKS